MAVDVLEERFLLRCRKLTGGQWQRLFDFLDRLENGTEPRTQEQTAKVLYLASRSDANRRPA